MLSGAAVSWRSKLQPIVALSTTEAEYVELSAAAQEAVHLRSLLHALRQQPLVRGPTVIKEDNVGALLLSDNPVLHARTKHIDVRFHFVRSLITARTVAVEYVHTSEQLADIFTKALPRPAHARLAGLVMGAARP